MQITGIPDNLARFQADIQPSCGKYRPFSGYLGNYLDIEMLHTEKIITRFISPICRFRLTLNYGSEKDNDSDIADLNSC